MGIYKTCTDVFRNITLVSFDKNMEFVITFCILVYWFQLQLSITVIKDSFVMLISLFYHTAIPFISCHFQMPVEHFDLGLVPPLVADEDWWRVPRLVFIILHNTFCEYNEWSTNSTCSYWFLVRVKCLKIDVCVIFCLFVIVLNPLRCFAQNNFNQYFTFVFKFSRYNIL